MPNPFDFPRFTLPKFEMPELKITFAAEEVFRILRDRIEALERELDAEHELAVECLGAPTMYLERFGWDGRYLL